MDLLTKKTSELKLKIEENESTYLELKKKFFELQQDATDKENLIRSLTHKNQFLEDYLTKHNSSLKESSDQIEKNSEKIKELQASIDQLVIDIELLETKYDEMSKDYKAVQAELDEISQFLT